MAPAGWRSTGKERDVEPIGADPVVTLPEFLRARARASTPRRLAFDVAGGAVIAAAALWARPTGWAVLASAASCFAMYGLWAVAERHVAAGSRVGRPFTAYAWFMLRTGAAGLGMAAFLALVFVLLGLALGTWIS
jgi:hypothetical protein